MGGTTTRFVYDGDQAVEETNGSNVATLYRTPGVGFVRNGAQRYEQDERLGSVLAVRDQSGSLTGQSEYDAYGREVWTGASADRGSQRFVGAKGYQNDDASGMQLLGARYYLPALGRFLTQDPIGQGGGLNLYAYCGDSPLMGTDPAGTDMQSYLHDVGQVFLGYGDALNPVNWAKGAWGAGADLYGHTADNWNAGMGLMSFQAAQVQTGGDMASGLWSTLTDWSTPRAFGNSWMTGSMLLSPEIAKIPNITPLGLGDGFVGATGHITFFDVSWRGKQVFRLDYGELNGKPANLANKWRGKDLLHYHRRGAGPGQGIGRHRPYETSPHPGPRW